MPTKKTTHNLDMQQNKVTNLAEPTQNSDAATKSFVDTSLSGKQDKITGGASSILTSNLNVSSALISDASGKVAASSVTATELGHISGVTSSVQTQLNGKQAAITGAASTIATSDLATNVAVITSASGKIATSSVTATQLGYLSGVTSAIQTQLNGKASTSHTQAATTVTYNNASVAGFPILPNATPNNVQLAIDNLFTYANSGKTQIANAIGSPATASDSFSTLAGYITTINNKTYGVLKNVVLDEAVNKDDAIESYYRSMAPSKLPNITAPNGVNALCCAISDNNFMAVGSSSNPTVQVYSINGETYTKLSPVLGGNPTGTTNGCAFSKEATYLAAASNASTFLYIYKRHGEVFDKSLVTISANPTATARAVAFTADSAFLACGHDLGGAPLQALTVYQRSGDTFTKLSITDQPIDNVNGVSWTSDGQFLACAHASGNFLTIYQRSGTTFTKLNTVDVNPTGIGYACHFSPDDNYLAVAHATTPFVTIYKRSGTSFTKIADANFSQNPGFLCRSIQWSPDGIYLGLGMNGGNFQIVYKLLNDQFTKQTDPSTLPTGIGYGFAWTPDAGYYIVAHASTPSISVYKNTSTEYRFRKIADSNTASVGKFDKIYGLAKEAGTAGQTKQASILVGGGLL